MPGEGADSESAQKVECAAHGSSSSALVCQHLCTGEKLGFHYSAGREDDQLVCPDAWCDDCHQALVAADDWTDAVVGRADFKVVCERCYGLIRTRNWEQDDAAWQSLLESSVDYLQAQHGVLMRDFRLGDYDRWDWNQETAQLVFSNKGKPVVICSIVMVGSISTATDTWLWSWANDSLLEPVREAMRDVLEFGEERGFEKLAGAYWDGNEEDGWDMTAIAAKFLGGIGAYRCPGDHGFRFLVITGAHWAQ